MKLYELLTKLEEVKKAHGDQVEVKLDTEYGLTATFDVDIISDATRYVTLSEAP